MRKFVEVPMGEVENHANIGLFGEIIHDDTAISSMAIDYYGVRYRLEGRFTLLKEEAETEIKWSIMGSFLDNDDNVVCCCRIFDSEDQAYEMFNHMIDEYRPNTGHNVPSVLSYSVEAEDGDNSLSQSQT